MTTCIVVFRSKTDLFSFINEFKRSGGRIETVATPKEAKIGCGLSAKIEERYLSLAVRLIKADDYNSFFAIYKVKKADGRISTFRVF